MQYKNIFDAHAHYDDERFNEDRHELFEQMHGEGVCGIINNGVDIPSTKIALGYAEQYDYLYAAAGFHPTCLDNVPSDYIDQMEELLRRPKAVAVGEIGLDYHYDVPKDLQTRIFIEQLDLARQMKKPAIIHDREAHGDILEILKKERPQGLLHCFSGSVEMLREVLKIGMSITLGGVVTFKNARAALEVAAELPLDRLLLETDAPYLAPDPFRGKRCDSRMIKHTAEKIAQIRNMKTQELLDITYENAKRMFGLQPNSFAISSK